MGNETQKGKPAVRTPKADIRRLPFQCVKCLTNKVVSSEEPLDRLQPTLDPNTQVGYCAKCRGRRMFKREGSE